MTIVLTMKKSKHNVLDVLFDWHDVQMKIYFFGLKCFMIMLFVVFVKPFEGNVL